MGNYVFGNQGSVPWLKKTLFMQPVLQPWEAAALGDRLNIGSQGSKAGICTYSSSFPWKGQLCLLSYPFDWSEVRGELLTQKFNERSRDFVIKCYTSAGKDSLSH